MRYTIFMILNNQFEENKAIHGTACVETRKGKGIYMKKYITTLLLIVSILAGVTLQPGVTAGAASFGKCQPKVSVASQSGSTVKLCIDKVKGATTYKVYRATSKNGDYKCIGSTKGATFKDTAANNAKCYYKVKACKVTSKTTTTSKCSKVVSVSKPSKTEGSKNEPEKTQQPSNSTGTTGSSQDSNSYADEVLKIVNQERAKAGLAALTTNTTLQNAANKRAQEIATSFSHTRPDGRSTFTVLDEYNISYRAAGENIAYGQKTPSEVMNAWMNSAGHKANILGSQFGKVGIGVYKVGNVYYWSQEFTD